MELQTTAIAMSVEKKIAIWFDEIQEWDVDM